MVASHDASSHRLTRTLTCPQDAVEILERLSKDSVDYIRQIAFISLAMVLVNQGKDNEKVEALRKTLDERVKVSTGVRVGTGWSVMGGVGDTQTVCPRPTNGARGRTNPVWQGGAPTLSVGCGVVFVCAYLRGEVLGQPCAVPVLTEEAVAPGSCSHQRQHG